MCRYVLRCVEKTQAGIRNTENAHKLLFMSSACNIIRINGTLTGLSSNFRNKPS